jgi:histidinol-phosphate aminotransferase
MNPTRRQWLRQASLAVAGLSVAHKNFAADNNVLLKRPGINDRIILSSNENPYGPAPIARKAMQEAALHSNRYPWFPTDATTQIREKIGTQYGLSKDHVLLGAGSSDILGSIAQHVALQKGNIVMSEYTFRIWTNAARKLGIAITAIPLTADKVQDIDKMYSAIAPDTKMVYVCNPNNPTGTIIQHQKLKQFAEEVSRTRLVVIDEAYIEYCDEPSLAGMVSSNKNIIVAKTFSKIYGMAGARIGYALAHPETIAALAALQPWANAGANAMAIAGALASLNDKAFVVSSKKLNAEARSYTITELAKLNIATIPSHTNFIFYNYKDYPKDIATQLTAANIIVGRIAVDEKEKWGRITIGTLDEMKAFIKALQ